VLVEASGPSTKIRADHRADLVAVFEMAMRLITSLCGGGEDGLGKRQLFGIEKLSYSLL
jgi:hypothetical protein